MKHLIIFIVLAALYPVKSFAAEDVFFIRLNIDDERIEFGEFSATNSKDVITGFDIDEPYETSLAVMQNFFSDHVQWEQSSDILFFIHAMWGSNNLFVRSQVFDFQESYIKASDSPVQAVFYILWDTRRATYGGNKRNALESSALLKRLFSLLYAMKAEKDCNFHLMCHSMGNKVCFDVLENETLNDPLFRNIIFAAADVDETKLNNPVVLHNLNIISENAYVLFNVYDGLLILSSVRNFYSPLGLNPDQHISATNPNIHFVDCSFLTDNNKFPSSVTGHLYYSTSISTKRRIKEIIGS